MSKVCMARVSLPGYELPLFAPMSADDEQALSGQTEIIFDFKKKRSAGNHRRYFAFIKQAFDMQEHYDSKEIFRKVLQMQAGHFDEVITEKGKPVYLPRTINWDELDEVEFKKLFNEVVNAFIKVYAHKLNDMQINQIVGF
jgi:hypothetical protein